MALTITTKGIKFLTTVDPDNEGGMVPLWLTILCQMAKGKNISKIKEELRVSDEYFYESCADLLEKKYIYYVNLQQTI